MTVRLAILALALAALQSQPTFRSGVDLIRLDVSVVDKSGSPVPDLRPEDFSVRVDGTPRKVSFARFYGAEEEASRTPAAPPSAGSFVTNVTRTPGRVVVFVADLESMNPGYEKLVLDTAGKLLDALGPSDAAGLVVIPGKGVDLTRDHGRVKAALTSMRGFAPMVLQQHVISMSEAQAFEKNDTRVIREVVERECRNYEPGCPRELRDEASQLLLEAHRRVQNVLTTLTTLNTRLQQIEAPKSLVLLSAGLPFPVDDMSRFRDLERQSAESGIKTYVVHLEQPDSDASRRGTPGSAALPRADLATGLTNVAGVTDGEYFAGIGKAIGVFDRIRLQITNTYQIGLEAQPQDIDGRSHQLVVQVTRTGVTVKARKELAVSTTPRPARTPVDILGLPTDVVETPMAVSAYSTRGQDDTTLKVILLVELLAGKMEEPLPTYAISITKDDQTAFETADKTSVAGPAGARAVISAQLAPGQYRLRGAVLDSSGRPGSIEMPLAVGLRRAGAFQFSDLLVGTTNERFAPASHVPSDAPITALLELYTNELEQFDDVNVDLELRKGNDPAVIAHATAAVVNTEQDHRRVAQGELTAPRLEAGLYSVSAIIKKGAVPIGKVSRTVAIKAP
jgi:VWFA-related protein